MFSFNAFSRRLSCIRMGLALGLFASITYILFLICTLASYSAPITLTPIESSVSNEGAQ